MVVELLKINGLSIHITAKKTNLISKIQKFGKVFLYDPIFYLTDLTVGKFRKKDAAYMFTFQDLDLTYHCEKIYNEIADNKDIFLISHSRGYMIAHVFASLYSKYIRGYINLDGGKPDEEYELYLEKNSELDTISEKHLFEIFGELKKGMNYKENISMISKIVHYQMYKQYKKTNVDFDFPVYIMNNIYHDEEINIKMDDYVKTTLLNKIKFNMKYKLNPNVKEIWYVGKTHWFYIDTVDDIIEIIKKILGYRLCDPEKGIYEKYQKYKSKYLSLKDNL